MSKRVAGPQIKASFDCGNTGEMSHFHVDIVWDTPDSARLQIDGPESEFEFRADAEQALEMARFIIAELSDEPVATSADDTLIAELKAAAPQAYRFIPGSSPVADEREDIGVLLLRAAQRLAANAEQPATSAEEREKLDVVSGPNGDNFTLFYSAGDEGWQLERRSDGALSQTFNSKQDAINLLMTGGAEFDDDDEPRELVFTATSLPEFHPPADENDSEHVKMVKGLMNALDYACDSLGNMRDEHDEESETYESLTEDIQAHCQTLAAAAVWLKTSAEETTPRLMPGWERICGERRLEIEFDWRVVGIILQDLLASGHRVTIDHDGEDERFELPTYNQWAMNELFACDEETISVWNKDHQPIGFVKLVYGNDPGEVISDYSTNLESVLKRANDLCREYA